jgi:hypothetical protein
MQRLLFQPPRKDNTMSYKSVASRLTDAVLNHPELSESTKRELVNVIGSTRAQTKAERMPASWAKLRNTVIRVREGITGNRPRWRPVIAPLFQEYVEILNAVIALIDTQRTAYDSIEECSKHTVTRNAQRAAEYPPRKSLGERNTHWQSWVPPHVITGLTQRVEQAYATAAHKNQLRGKRFIPFQPINERVVFTAQVARVRKAIENIRFRVRDDTAQHNPRTKGVEHATGSTPYRALMLCACSQAARALSVIVKRVDSGAVPIYHPDAVVPVDWRALLSPELRARLSCAALFPNDVSTDGLDSFLSPRPGVTVEQGNDGLCTDEDTPTPDEDTPTPDERSTSQAQHDDEGEQA